MAENNYDLDYTGSMVDRILDTGYDLQNQGYIFRGLASHYTGTPTERTWLIAPTGSTGFGLSSPVPPGSIGICMYNGSSWSAEVLNTLTLDSAPTAGSGNGITSGAVKTLAESITNAIGQLEQSVSDRFTSLELEDTTGSLQAEVLSITLKYVFEGETEALTSLSILAATSEKAGLMSAADKQKLDAFVTNIRSLRIQDTTAQADQDTEITNTLKWTIGGVTEAITAFTLYAATTSKAGLMSAADKTALDTLPSLINAGYLYAGIATPSTVPSTTSAKIFYIAIEGGTYTSFGSLSITQGINILYKSGNAWSVAQAVGIDNEPTAGSDNLVKSGGVKTELALGAVYDVSAHNNGATFESLSALLSDTDLNALIPTAVRKGGMSIKFVQSSDNKYVQYFLTKNLWSLSPNDWDKVNLEREVDMLQFHVFGGLNYKEGYSLDVSGEEVKDENYCVSDYAEIPDSARSAGLIFYYGTYAVGRYLILYNAQKEEIDHYGMLVGNTYRGLSSSQVGNAVYARFSFAKNYAGKMTDRTTEQVVFYEADINKGIEERVYELDGDIQTIDGDIQTINTLLNEIVINLDSQNLVGDFNKISDCYVDGSGNLVSNVNYYTYKVKLQGAGIYYLNSSDHDDVHPGMLAFMDAEDHFISFLSNPSTATAPDNAAYMYVSFNTLVPNSIAQVTKGEQLPYINGDRQIAYGLINKYLEDLQIKPDIVFPRIEYVLQGEQNSLYHQAYMNNYNPNSFYVDKNGGSWKYFERCWRVESTDTANDLNFVLRSRKTQEIISTHQIAVRRGLKTNTANLCRINAIGDSFCYGGYYLKQVYEMCGNSEFVGMRKSQRYSAEAPVYCEGRGGWTLAEYFNPISEDVTPSHAQAFSPFMHASGYSYYGDIDFWKLIVTNTSQYPYGTGGFDKYVSWFGADGRKLNPSNNDLMYNHTSGKYEKYNGSQWVELDTAPTFDFDYSEYIRIWQIDAPDFVVIQLGTNDFFSGTIDFASWCEQMDKVIDSINAYATSTSKDIKILLCTVLTISSLPNNVYGDGDIKRNYFYWLKRKQVIERYDPSTEQVNRHVYVVDTGIVVDDKYGFLTEERKPFDYYEGDHREMYDINGVHPDVGGYKQFGNPIAGAIQYLRT